MNTQLSRIVEDKLKAYRCGWIALIGPPNAGKSTLTNTLVGQKVAIVSSKPQTTRNKIGGILTNNDMQVIFLDTPGICSEKNHIQGQLGKFMLQSAWQSLSIADSIICVIDGGLYVKKPDLMYRELEPFIEILKEEKRPIIIAVNKIDLFHDKSRMLPMLSTLGEYFPTAEIFPVSAFYKNGTNKLLETIYLKLPEGEAVFPEDQLSTVPVRFMVAEIIREKLFDQLYQEVPYAVAVEVEKWDEESRQNQVIIYAIIYVARASHKAMVIGQSGERIKFIGTMARKEIKALLGKKVHLELWVKVRESWINDSQFLHELGFGAEEMG